MQKDYIVMNEAGFRVSFVSSKELGQFVQWGVEHDVYYQSGDKQVAMLTEVWNICHRITNPAHTAYHTPEVDLVTKSVTLPKKVKIVKAKK
jgi:pterin-4a-carbinolamine dehydratase